MSDAKLKKKVQLRQKTEAPVVQLKRKGEAASTVHLKKKTDPAAADAAAVAATAAAVTTLAAEKAAAAAGVASAAGVTAQFKQGTEATGMGAVPTKKAGSTGESNIKSSSSSATENSAAGSTGRASGSNVTSGNKKEGKVWGWIFGAAAVAGLTFGGIKLANNNGDKSSLLANTTAVEGTFQNGNESEAATTYTGKTANPDAKSNGANTNSANVSEESGTASTNASSDGNTTAIGNGAATNGSNDAQPANHANNGSNPSQADQAPSGNAANESDANVSQATSSANESTTSGSPDNSSASNSVSATTANKANASGSSNVNPSNASGRQVNASSSSANNTSMSSSSVSTISGTSKTTSNDDSSTAIVNEPKPAVIKAVSDDSATCLFAFDSTLIDESDVLNKLVETAKSSGKKVVINAFADETGEDEYNQALSQRRANAIKSYFVKRGVDAVIISAIGNGESTQYSTKAENRRADISIQ